MATAQLGFALFLLVSCRLVYLAKTIFNAFVHEPEQKAPPAEIAATTRWQPAAGIPLPRKGQQ